jgi:hypothetical protein
MKNPENKNLSDPYANLHSQSHLWAIIGVTALGAGFSLTLGCGIWAIVSTTPNWLQLLGVCAFAALVLTAIPLLIINVNLNRQFKQRWSQSPDRGFGAYVREYELFAPKSPADSAIPTLTGWLRGDLYYIASIEPYEIDALLEGLETDKQQIALLALINHAWPVYNSHGRERARLDLLTHLSATPAAQIIRDAISQSRDISIVTK